MAITAQTILAELERLAESDPEKLKELEHFRDLLAASGYYMRSADELIITFPPDADLSSVISNRQALEKAIQDIADRDELFTVRVMARLGDGEAAPFADFVREIQDDMVLHGDGMMSASQGDMGPEVDEFVAEQDRHADELTAEEEAAELAASTEFHDQVANDLNSVERLTRKEREDAQGTQDESDAASLNSYTGQPSTVADLISGAGRLAVSPLTLAGKAVGGGLNKLSDWRKSRPGKYLEQTRKAEEDLLKNLAAFRNGRFKDFEASVKASDGWNVQISNEFEDAIESDRDFKRDWELVKDQFRHYQFLAHKALKLNADNAEEIEQELTAGAERVGEAGGPVPMEMKLGMVKSTIEEESSAFAEFIKRFVAKLVKRVLNSFGLDNSPSVPQPGHNA